MMSPRVSLILIGMVCLGGLLAAAAPVPALVSRDGTLSIGDADVGSLAELSPAVFAAGWQQSRARADATAPATRSALML